MKTIKIFLASSEELDYDRMAFGNLVRRLDDMYEKRGIRIKLFEWEDYDSAYNDRRKQDEYNDYVRQSDIFLALFHKKAGQFTVEEFDLASQEFKEHASPKVYTYCKDLKPGEEETPELTEFKKRLFDEMGHYWCRYDNRESLHLQFVMQLQLVESSQMADMKVENGNVTINGLPIASIDKLKFASCNEEYIKMSEELASLPEEIEMYRMMADTHPDQPKYKDQLQKKLDKFNQLKKDLEDYQQILFNTAKRIVQLQGKRITERMQRAMDAFNDGKVREANIILDEAETDARRNFEDYKQIKEVTELKRQAVFNSIEELLLKTSTIMADASIPIEERIENTQKTYTLADEMAQGTDYDNEQYIVLLYDYWQFLTNYAKYDAIQTIIDSLIDKCEDFYGKEHLFTASIYNDISTTYLFLGKYKTAMDFCNRSLSIREKELGDEHPDTANTYINLGNIYSDQGDNTKALEYYQKALGIMEMVLGAMHLDTAHLYNNIGIVYSYLGDFTNAINYHKKALRTIEEILGDEHPDTATSYNNIGVLYDEKGDYNYALEYLQKALVIRMKVLGCEHPDTAMSYNNIGVIYEEKSDYTHALEYHQRALVIREKVFGCEHPDTATSYDNIGIIYEQRSDYINALHYHQKALIIREKMLGNKHPDTALSYNNIAWTYHLLRKDNEALPWAEKAISSTHDNPDTIDTLATIYQGLGKYDEAMEQFKLCLKLYKIIGYSDDINATKEKIAALKQLMK